MGEILTLDRRSVFLRIEKGDLGEDGAEPNLILELVLGVEALVLHSSFGLLTTSLLLLSTFLLAKVLQRKRGVDGLLLLALCLSASATAAVVLSLGRVLQNALRQPLPIL